MQPAAGYLRLNKRNMHLLFVVTQFGTNLILRRFNSQQYYCHSEVEAQQTRMVSVAIIFFCSCTIMHVEWADFGEYSNGAKNSWDIQKQNESRFGKINARLAEHNFKDVNFMKMKFYTEVNIVAPVSIGLLGEPGENRHSGFYLRVMTSGVASEMTEKHVHTHQTSRDTSPMYRRRFYLLFIKNISCLS